MTWPTRAGAAALTAAAVLTLAAVAAYGLRGPAGLLLVAGPIDALATTAPRRVGSIDLRDLGPAAQRPPPTAARWAGLWRIENAGAHRVVVDTEGAVRVAVDGAPVLHARGGRGRGEVILGTGVHALEVAYEGGPPPRRLRVHAWDPEGRRLHFGGTTVFTAAPSPLWLALDRAAPWLAGLAVVAWGLCFGLAARRAGRRGNGLAPALRVAVPVAIVLYAVALRFEALVERYAWDGPQWAVGMARGVSRLHPDALVWDPSLPHEGGDPFHYYRRAREMRAFYEPHVREPLFPFAARLLLPLVGDRPLVVSVASALFSAAGVLATCLLGAAAFGRAAGFGAALLLAVDRDVLWWGVEGFRDDAFLLFVVLSAWTLLRLRRRPTLREALLAGLCGGAACLTRITALSFLLPAWALLAWGRDQDAPARRKTVGIAASVAVALVGPYMAACALAWGDPFHAINAHTAFYRSRSGLAEEARTSWPDYLRARFEPGGLVATAVTGLTTYPFQNKWRGLDYISPMLRRVLAPAAVVGLVLLAFLPAGRLLLVVLFGSLLPYAFTWNVPGGSEWRFTMHAYPFYLMAASSAAVRLGERVSRRRIEGRVTGC